MNRVIGEFIGGSARIWEKRGERIVGGLQLENGKEVWFEDAYVGEFSSNLALTDNGVRMGYINRMGELVIPMSFEIADDFSEKLAFVSDLQKTWLIDTSADIVHEFDESFVTGQFSDGLAHISRIPSQGKGENRIDGFVDRVGEWVIPCVYEKQIEKAFEFVDPDDIFSESLVRMAQSGKYGFLDKKNRWVIPPEYDWCSRFSDGLAAVRMRSAYGYINRENELELPLGFDCASRFSQDLAAVSIHGNWGYIDRKGNLQMETRYQWAAPFLNDTAAVCQNNKWGLIDGHGIWIVLPQYDAIRPFVEGICEFKLGQRTGKRDIYGNEVIGQTETPRGFADMN